MCSCLICDSSQVTYIYFVRNYIKNILQQNSRGNIFGDPKLQSIYRYMAGREGEVGVRKTFWSVSPSEAAITKYYKL